MMGVGLVELIERVAPKICAEVFASQGIALRRHFGPVPPAWQLGSRVAGVVEVRGERVRGNVVLVAGFPLLAGCRSASTRHLSETLASDWLLVRHRAAELTTSLLERARECTLGHPDVWQAGPARAVSGMALETTVRHLHASPLAFDAPGDVVLVWFDLEGPPASIPPISTLRPGPSFADAPAGGRTGP
jgi:hypothetical protein